MQFKANQFRGLTLSLMLSIAGLLGVSGLAHSATPAISSGNSHTLALGSDGTLRSWGADSFGQLGIGTPISASIPVNVTGVAAMVNISAGEGFNLSLKSDGTVWAWGSNAFGQLGDGTLSDRISPAVVSGLDNVRAIHAGYNHSVALKKDGSVWTWGFNGFGQLGNNTYVSESVPVKVPYLDNVVAIAAGNGHTIVLKADGTVWSWGLNGSGQLGDGTYTSKPFPVKVAWLSNVIAIAAGGYHTLAVKGDGTVWAWGNNGNSQLGYDTSEGGSTSTPIRVFGLENAVSVSAGFYFSLALRADGTVFGWGNNIFGMLGDSTNIQRSVPTPVVGLDHVVRIAAGTRRSIALRVDGTVWAWGENGSGELGDGSKLDRYAPVQIPQLSKAVSVTSGFTHSAAVTEDGMTWAWGNNSTGQLGYGGVNNRSAPQTLASLTDVVSTVAAGEHSVALRNDGSVWTWGLNSLGQLGDGSTTTRSSPVRVGGLGSATAISANMYHSAAVVADGTAWTWGSGICGKLGDLTGADALEPVQVFGLDRVQAISAGTFHTIALRSDGSVWAWGCNGYGQLGDGSYSNRIFALPVFGLSNVVAIAAGNYHNLALKSDGSVWAWGHNFGGELGDGTTTTSSVPVRVNGIGGATAIATGAISLALKNDGTVWSWGDNRYGQLGDGSTTNRTSPVQVQGLSGVAGISTAKFGNRLAYYSTAVKQDGTVWSWGNNVTGQLGDGTYAQRLTPVVVLRENGNGTLLTNDWYLNLTPATAKTIPADKLPSFEVLASASGSDFSKTISTRIKYKASDVGASGSVFITARVPQGSFGVPQTKAKPGQARKARDSGSFVLIQLTSSGWQQVVNGQLIPYVSGVLGDLLSAQTILDATDVTQLKGAEFCLGYGADAADLIASGKIRVVATIPTDPNSPNTPSVSCIVQGASATPPNYSDSWWNANESGWGITITDHGSNAFVQWYTYDQSGHNQKYVISGGTFTTDKCQFSGTLVRVTGPSWTAPSFDPNLVTRTNVGSGSFDFCPTGLAAGTIVFNYTADGVTGSKQLTRLPFGNDVPHLGGTANTGATDFTDLWWNPAESGWGVSVTQHGNNVFFRVFVYDTDGRPLLFVVPGVTFNSPTSFTGAITLTTGPYFGTVPFDPNQVVRTTAGTATLTFSDANNGVLSYTVNGVTKTKAITRLAF